MRDSDLTVVCAKYTGCETKTLGLGNTFLLWQHGRLFKPFESLSFFMDQIGINNICSTHVRVLWE